LNKGRTQFALFYASPPFDAVAKHKRIASHPRADRIAVRVFGVDYFRRGDSTSEVAFDAAGG
jgi:hypothetical protein